MFDIAILVPYNNFKSQTKIMHLKRKKEHSNQKVKELLKTCREYPILAVYLFGSMMQEGSDFLDNRIIENIDPLSDLDVGIVFLNPELNPTDKISLYKRLFAGFSDLFSPFNLDLVFLQETGVILQFDAINGMLIYSYDDDMRLDYEEKVIKLYQDWKPVYDLYVKEVLEAIH